jgi:outer membrane lipoprotein SlyB
MKKIALVLSLAVLASCAKNPSQNTYNYNEVGQSTIMEYAVVVKVKEIDITGRNTGAGSALGATAGGVAGYQMGNGNGQIATVLAGAVIGGIAGHVAEQAAADQKGYEYTVVAEDKKTKKVVQYQNKDDVVFRKGDRVMIETTGTYQRVLPTDDLPDSVKKPRGIKVVD